MIENYKYRDMVVDNFSVFPFNINLIIRPHLGGYEVNFLESKLKIANGWINNKNIKCKYNNQLFRYLYF